MLKVGLIGIGFMGRSHLDCYLRLREEGFPVEVTAICDIDAGKFGGVAGGGNIGVGIGAYDFSPYRLYTDYNEMLDSESFDFVDIALPTYLHKPATVAALDKGVHVLCEKPMALSGAECDDMIEAQRRSGKRLMIGQCLRFWPAYEFLKSCAEDGRYGSVRSAYLFRGSTTPIWSHDNWMLDEARSGGSMLDLHVHDADIVRWVFGHPKAVSTIGKNVVPGAGYDILSSNYMYDDGKVVNVQCDWTLPVSFGFEMSYRVNFDEASVSFNSAGVVVNPKDGASFSPELSADTGYYREIRYFAQCLLDGTPPVAASAESVADTIRLVEAERESADGGGRWVATAARSG